MWPLTRSIKLTWLTKLLLPRPHRTLLALSSRSLFETLIAEQLTPNPEPWQVPMSYEPGQTITIDLPEDEHLYVPGLIRTLT